MLRENGEGKGKRMREGRKEKEIARRRERTRRDVEWEESPELEEDRGGNKGNKKQR